MIYMSSVERCSGGKQLCVHAQPCMQGSGDAACLLCMPGAVIFHMQLDPKLHDWYVTRQEHCPLSGAGTARAENKPAQVMPSTLDNDFCLDRANSWQVGSLHRAS
jgi:hypothetical protein